MSLASFFGFQSSDSTITATSKQKPSPHLRKPLLKVHVPGKLPKYQHKTYLPPTDNCASPLGGAFGSSFLLRTSDFYNIVHIIDGEHDNSGTSTYGKNHTSGTSSLKTQLIQHINDEMPGPLSPIYSDVKTRRNPDLDISDLTKSSPSPFPNDEEIYIPYVLSPGAERQASLDSQRMEGWRNSYDSGVGMSFDEKLDNNNSDSIKNVTSREIDLYQNSKIYDPVSSRDSISSTASTSSIRFNSSLHKSSLYGPNGIPPLFTSSVNDYIGDSGSENWIEY